MQSEHYAMDDVKKRIIQFIAVRILNPERRGPILCLIGPPGVGKTTIAKAISDSLNRTFKRFYINNKCYINKKCIIHIYLITEYR